MLKARNTSMVLDASHKLKMKQELDACLANDTEISRIVVFGSFNNSESPADMDVAIFQTSDLPYIPLAMKYRRQARSISKRIPLDIIPVRPNATDSPFLDEINKGETIYER
jgi:hypothetical protein